MQGYGPLFALFALNDGTQCIPQERLPGTLFLVHHVRRSHYKRERWKGARRQGGNLTPFHLQRVLPALTQNAGFASTSTARPATNDKLASRRERAKLRPVGVASIPGLHRPLVRRLCKGEATGALLWKVLC